MNPLQNFVNSINTNPYAQGVEQGAEKATSAIQNNPVAKFFLGSAMNTAQDIGAGVSANKTESARGGANAQGFNVANQTYNAALKEKDPVKRRAMFEQAQSILRDISGSEGDVARSFSPEVKGNPAIRGLSSAAQIASSADMISHPVTTVKGLYNIVRHPIQTVQGLVGGANQLVQHPVDTIKSLPWDLEHSFKLQGGENGLTKLGDRFLAGQFKDAGDVVKNPAETMHVLHGKYGLSSPEDIASGADIITGKNGIVNQAVNKAVKLGGPINLGEVTDPAGNILRPGLERTAQNLIGNQELIQPNTEKKIMQTISNTAMKSVMPDAPGVADPEKVMDSLRTFEAKANAVATPGTEAAQVRDVYRGLVNDLKQRLFFDNEINNIHVASLFSPEDLQKLKSVGNGQMAQDVLNTNVEGLRNLQSHFVQGSQMARHADQVADAVPNVQQAMGLTASTMSGNPIPAAAAAAQSRIGMGAVGNALSGIGGLNGGAAQTAVDIASQALPKITAPQNPVNMPPPITNDQSGGVSSTDISSPTSSSLPGIQIPGSMGDIKPGSNGRYNVLNPYTSGAALSDQDYINQKSQILQEQALPQNQVFPNSQRIQSRLADLENKYKISQNVKPQYTETLKLTNLANDAYDKIKSAPPNLLSLNASYDKLRLASDGKYARLADELQILERQAGLPPGSLFRAQTQQVAFGNLDLAQKVIQNNFNAVLSSYLSPSSQGQSIQNTDPSQAAASSINLPPIQQGGMIQATAPNELLQLQPLPLTQ